MPGKEIKLVAVGSGGVGKSAISIQFVESIFVQEYDPTIEDCFRKQCTVDGQVAMLEILDTAGQEEYSAMRAQYFRGGEGFLGIYSITSRESFDELKTLREQIVRIKDTDRVPMVIIGNKVDLAHDRQVSAAEGEEFARACGCLFFESSAKENINVEQPFYALVRGVRQQQGPTYAAPRAIPVATPVASNSPKNLGPTSIGLQEDLLASLAYLFYFVGGLLVVLLEKQSTYAVFHGAQSMAVSLVFFPAWIVAAIIDAILVINLLIFVRVFGLIVAIIWLFTVFFCMYKAYTLCNTQIFRLPLIAPLADLILRTLRKDLAPKPVGEEAQVQAQA